MKSTLIILFLLTSCIDYRHNEEKEVSCADQKIVHEQTVFANDTLSQDSIWKLIPVQIADTFRFISYQLSNENEIEVQKEIWDIINRKFKVTYNRKTKLWYTRKVSDSDSTIDIGLFIVFKHQNTVLERLVIRKYLKNGKMEINPSPPSSEFSNIEDWLNDTIPRDE